MSKRSVFLPIVIIVVLVAADQLIKNAIVYYMPLGDRIGLLPFLSLYHTQNSGIAFSMLSSFHDWGLIGLTVAVILFVFWLWWGTAQDRFLANMGYLLVISGALGNLIDRLRFHYVTDYILFHVGDWSFAVFNLADAFITVGAALIILNELISWRRETRDNNKKNQN